MHVASDPSAASERARGCTGLVKLICKENKEQRGKKKFHEGEPHPNDRGFTQWFGSCSLINVWFPASWAPMVAERLFGLSSNPGASSYPQHGQPASRLSQHQSGVHPYAVSKEPLAHLYYSGDSHRGDFRTDLSQGAAQAAGQASLDGGQAALERVG